MQGSFRLFRLAGIDVFLHWSWFAVAAVQIVRRSDVYEAWPWKVLEYLTLFGIVLLHEFGHAFACRSVGGQVERIVLWPLGGVAYVSPPPRPGPVLWSIAAGPLVNVALVPVLGLLFWLALRAGWRSTHHDAFVYLRTITALNVGLLVFNLLPIFPLDGGQILHALLWFVVGRWRGLLVAARAGGVCGVALVAAALALAYVVDLGALVAALVAALIVLRSFAAFQGARTMLRLERLPRHEFWACPACGERAPRGDCWRCLHCATQFDPFEARGTCPGCGECYPETGCPYCQATSEVEGWHRGERA